MVGGEVASGGAVARGPLDDPGTLGGASMYRPKIISPTPKPITMDKMKAALYVLDKNVDRSDMTQ